MKNCFRKGFKKNTHTLPLSLQKSYLAVAPIDIAEDHPRKKEKDGIQTLETLMKRDVRTKHKLFDASDYFYSSLLTMSAGGGLKATGLWCGVLPEEAAVGRADRLV